MKESIPPLSIFAYSPTLLDFHSHLNDIRNFRFSSHKLANKSEWMKRHVFRFQKHSQVNFCILKIFVSVFSINENSYLGTFFSGSQVIVSGVCSGTSHCKSLSAKSYF